MITVVVMLGVAGLALLVDFLRARNLQLQQTVSELRGHNEIKHAQRALDPLMKRPAEASPAPPMTAAEPVPVAVEQPVEAQVERDIVRKAAPVPHAQRAAREMRIRKPVAGAAKDELRRARDAAAELTSRTGRWRNSAPAGAPLPKLDGLNSQAALEEWLNRRAAQRAARNPRISEIRQDLSEGSPAPVEAPADVVAETPVAETAAETRADVTVERTEITPVFESQVVELVAEPVAVEAVVMVETEPEPMIEVTPEIEDIADPMDWLTVDAPEVVAEVAPVEVAVPEVALYEVAGEPIPVAPSGLPPVQIDAALWEALFGTKPEDDSPVAMEEQVQSVPSAEPEVIFEVIRGGPHGLLVPAGMHERSALARLLSTPKPFTGLVVSIGVDSQDGGSELTEDLLRSIENHIASLLREKDFACHTESDEFLLVCPGENAADAQRRLNQISERLWDYQLRSIGTFSMLFSSGGLHVQSEPLSDAIASAEERMSQTRRSRKAAIVESVNQRRQAV